MSIEFSKKLTVEPIPSIPGMVVVQIPVHGDNRGWFKENWQREKMIAMGLPDFHPVQNNISFNESVGTTTGIHAEPWDKYITVATGSIFGAWVDLRAGETFGNSFTLELDASTAVFVPRGVGNAFQTLEDNTAYVYLVNDHWSEQAQSEYTFLNLADSDVQIDWPISLDRAELSDKDRAHPLLVDVVPMQPKKILVLGASGQLGRALRGVYDGNEHVDFLDRNAFDLANEEHYANLDWAQYDTVVNAGAYTKVDEAETAFGRVEAWSSNVDGVSKLAKICSKHDLTLVHVSSDYVFDGTKTRYLETDPCSPLGVYGQTKAAGEAVVATVPRHLIIRTSWVIGDGHNFVRTMATLAVKGIAPSVVNDQIGRLTFTEDLAKGIRHLIESQAPYGVYNLSNSGPAQSWADVAKKVFSTLNWDPSSITGVSTQTYFANKEAASRPLNSILDLSKLEATGFKVRSQDEALDEYLTSLNS